MEGHDDGTMTQAEFAAAQGWTQARVSQLKAEGRLVMTDDGRRVRAAESLARIESTRDPAHAGRAARRASQKAALARAAGQGATPPSSAPHSAPEAAGGAAAPEPANGSQSAPQAPGAAPDYVLESDYQGRRARALALQEEAAARKAARDEEIELGTLLRADEVRAVIADAATTFRTTLENLGPTIAPMLAATGDESRIVVMLADAHEQVLAELARKFQQIGAQPQ